MGVFCPRTCTHEHRCRHRTCFFNNSALNELLDNLALQDAALLKGCCRANGLNRPSQSVQGLAHLLNTDRGQRTGQAGFTPAMGCRVVTRNGVFARRIEQLIDDLGRR